MSKFSLDLKLVPVFWNKIDLSSPAISSTTIPAPSAAAAFAEPEAIRSVLSATSR